MLTWGFTPIEVRVTQQETAYSPRMVRRRRGRHSVAVTWLFTTDIEGYDQCLRSQHLPSKAEKLASVRNHAYWLRTATPSHCGR